MSAARTASRGLPIAASMAVTQVPTLAPKISAMPAGRVISPWLAIAITTPVVAEDDCTSPVKVAAARIPKRGFSIRTIQVRKPGWCRRGAIASPITVMPRKMRPSARMPLPWCRRLSRRDKKVSAKPNPRKRGCARANAR